MPILKGIYSDREYNLKDEEKGSGAVKTCYFTNDNKFAIAFYMKRPNSKALDRLNKIVTTYREAIFSASAGDFWSERLCWPEDVVEWQGKLGIVMKKYPSKYYFDKSRSPKINMKGVEKTGSWFTSLNNRTRMVHQDDLGHWAYMLSVCLNLSRGVRRLHASGLAHSDLSYNNVLIDPSTGSAMMIDLDGLVVPGLYSPDVQGSPGLTAPEIVSGKVNEQSIATDRHSLGVLIYQYLLIRHPLEGNKVFHATDPNLDEHLMYGEKALWIEDPKDSSNRKIPPKSTGGIEWYNTKKLPVNICGPFLLELFNRVFGEGLHQPDRRPTAAEWEYALIKTIDLLTPCVNPHCTQKFFVVNTAQRVCCPFCGQQQKQMPILEFYSKRGGVDWSAENERLVVFNGLLIWPWHTQSGCLPSERCVPKKQKPEGSFSYENQNWIFKPENKNVLLVRSENARKLVRHEAVILQAGDQLVFGDDQRLALVNM